MKKVLLLVSALLIVFSGVAAVSAYEGHMVNVKAHVENAIGVTDYEVDFGTVFPEETLETQIWVGLSESFRAQERYSSVQYRIFWEPKSIGDTANVCDPNDDGIYAPIWSYIDLEVNGDPIDDWIDMGDGLIAANATYLLTLGFPCDEIHFVIDPPVFEGFYNALTDPRTPSGIIPVEEYCLVVEDICGYDVEVPHADLGNDLKIQVWDIIVDVD